MSGIFSKRSAFSEWAFLSGLSAIIFAVLQLLHMPAALLLAGMLAGIAVSTRDFSIRIPKHLILLAQGLIGCLMALSLKPGMLGRVVQDWPLFLGFNVLVMGVSAALGWWLARHKVLPGNTAVWGLAPGAASAMVLMSDSYGADSRLVAFMQYTRVVIVTFLAALITRIWLGETPPDPSAPPWWGVHHAADVGWTAALVFAGVVLTSAAGFPSGSMLVILVAGVLLQGMGWLTIELPPLMLGCAYIVIGWSIGLRYTADTLLHVRLALPRVLLAIATLVGLGMCLAAALALVGGFDPLTAYLATSPGGADSVAIIAAHAVTVDAGFVMSMQIGRFLLVLLLGPRVSRWVCSRTG